MGTILKNLSNRLDGTLIFLAAMLINGLLVLPAYMNMHMMVFGRGISISLNKLHPDAKSM
jgi:hypothetical protein